MNEPSAVRALIEEYCRWIDLDLTFQEIEAELDGLPGDYAPPGGLLLVGFMLMMVMGVATWMFPRPAREDSRYRPELAEAVYWVMTAATAVRAGAELGVAAGALGLRWLIAIGGLGQLAGAVLFVLNMWWRVRMPPTAAPSAR